MNDNAPNNTELNNDNDDNINTMEYEKTRHTENQPNVTHTQVEKNEDMGEKAN